jgi:hypothetical protein
MRPTSLHLSHLVTTKRKIKHQFNAINRQHPTITLIAIMYAGRMKFAIIVSTLLSIL